MFMSNVLFPFPVPPKSALCFRRASAGTLNSGPAKTYLHDRNGFEH